MNTSTSLESVPAPLAAPVADRPVEDAAQECHEHAWVTASRHATSEGIILYVRCACGAWRVDTVDAASMRPPRALSHTIPDRTSGTAIRRP